MKVFLSKVAEEKLIEISNHLLTNWGNQSKRKFNKKFSEKISQITNQPESCPVSPVFDGLFKCVITKQTIFYYRINKSKKEIEIVTFFDARQNPESLKDLI